MMRPDPAYRRTEQWTKIGETILVEVNILDETVICSYQYIASMLADLGFEKEE